MRIPRDLVRFRLHHRAVVHENAAAIRDEALKTLVNTRSVCSASPARRSQIGLGVAQHARPPVSGSPAGPLAAAQAPTSAHSKRGRGGNSGQLRVFFVAPCKAHEVL